MTIIFILISAIIIQGLIYQGIIKILNFKKVELYRAILLASAASLTGIVFQIILFIEGSYDFTLGLFALVCIILVSMFTAYRLYSESILRTISLFGCAIIPTLVLIFIVRATLITPFIMSGMSMKDTINNKDYLVGNKIVYQITNPKAGDVVIFKNPTRKYKDYSGIDCIINNIENFSIDLFSCKRSELWMKRIVGVPGDSIVFEDGYVYINGKRIDESEYLNINNNGNTHMPIFNDKTDYVVPNDSYYMLSDNRNGGSDSRYWRDLNGKPMPYIHKTDIVGKIDYGISTKGGLKLLNGISQ